VQLWPRLEINEWPRYGLMYMYNITGICQFCKSVANCDKWPVYKGGANIVIFTVLVGGARSTLPPWEKSAVPIIQETERGPETVGIW